MKTISELYQISEELTKQYSKMDFEQWKSDSKKLADELLPLMDNLPLDYNSELSTVIARSIVFYSPETRLMVCERLWRAVLASSDFTLKNSFSGIIDAVSRGLDRKSLCEKLPISSLDLKKSYPISMVDVIRYLQNKY